MDASYTVHYVQSRFIFHLNYLQSNSEVTEQ